MPKMPEGSDKQATDAAAFTPGPEHGESGMGQAFISYASADSAIAHSVCAALERAGVNCWIAPRDVTPGEFYSEAIVHAIDAAKEVVLILSQNAATSEHVLREVERASSKRHTVVSFRIDLAPIPAALEYFLNTAQWLEASATGIERALPKLVDAVQRSVAHAGAARPGGHADPDVSIGAQARQQPRLMLGALAAIIVLAIGYITVNQFWLSKRVDEQKSLVKETPASPTESLLCARSRTNRSRSFQRRHGRKDGPGVHVRRYRGGTPEDAGEGPRHEGDCAHVPSLKGKTIEIAERAKKLNVAMS